MKEGIHPAYHKVIYVDSATGEEWISRSTITSAESREVDGEELPVVKLEISAASHPFWTGKMRELDADGKIERFNKRWGKKKVSEEAQPVEEPPQEVVDPPTK